jgi:phosphoglycolate phosphatase-like HAD superfamily hydrolase
VGIDRYTAVKGVRPVAEDVLIIGDTIHDVACGLAHGCRVLGVATGHDSADTLARAGAHRVVENLSDTQGITAWITRSNLTPT